MAKVKAQKILIFDLGIEPNEGNGSRNAITD